MNYDAFFKKIVICLPTYNEAANLPQITEAILRIIPSAVILVIDDNSPDGTGAVAEKMRLENPQISVLHRVRKEGLGRAYLEGFRTVLKNMPEVERIVQMDADFSHPPERLPEMIRRSESADLVIGSRYVKGGGTENWSLFRQLISRFGSLYARLWLGLPVRDLTGGFKVWRRDLLEKILSCPIGSGGYGFQAETTFFAFRSGARIAEVPILFTDRNVGKSKMTAGIAWEAFWRLPLIRVREVKIEK
jgi:dolichol-phosphate mannosyltransferase